jgi:hypothetical protein
MAERSKALDWNSSNIFTGVRGFESHSLRQMKRACPQVPFYFGGEGARTSPPRSREQRFAVARDLAPHNPVADIKMKTPHIVPLSRQAQRRVASNGALAVQDFRDAICRHPELPAGFNS